MYKLPNADDAFKYVRPKKTGLFPGKLYVKQVQGIEGLINECHLWGCSTIQTAYILATAHHETGRTYNREQREIGRGKGKPYGKPAGPYNQIYYGRSLNQVTWYQNYARLEGIYQQPFVENPDLIMDERFAYNIMIRGMMQGFWTDRQLDTYINNTTRDYYGARTVVNGHDKWELIRDYCHAWQDALIIGGYEPRIKEEEPEPMPNPVTPVPTKPWYASRTIWGAIMTLVATLLHVVFNISLSDGMQDQLIELVIAVLGGSGGIMAIIGRIIASMKIA